MEVIFCQQRDSGDHDSYKQEKPKGETAQIAISKVVATTKAEIFNSQKYLQGIWFQLGNVESVTSTLTTR